ncbi:hypothetical protein AMS68_003279 [Peltaster fructicola]|uniref:Uncharacterized protein n=1 Tax=Peltaster fructicola TaxID=286661 RepID=A0A6H0XSL9_9PEZI|nr:hypothetical protein AMS68_003279 [Peltaster fructicola]
MIESRMQDAKSITFEPFTNPAHSAIAAHDDPKWARASRADRKPREVRRQSSMRYYQERQTHIESALRDQKRPDVATIAEPFSNQDRKSNTLRFRAHRTGGLRGQEMEGLEPSIARRTHSRTALRHDSVIDTRPSNVETLPRSKAIQISYGETTMEITGDARLDTRHGLDDGPRLIIGSGPLFVASSVPDNYPESPESSASFHGRADRRLPVHNDTSREPGHDPDDSSRAVKSARALFSQSTIPRDSGDDSERYGFPFRKKVQGGLSEFRGSSLTSSTTNHKHTAIETPQSTCDHFQRCHRRPTSNGRMEVENGAWCSIGHAETTWVKPAEWLVSFMFHHMAWAIVSSQH